MLCRAMLPHPRQFLPQVRKVEPNEGLSFPLLWYAPHGADKTMEEDMLAKHLALALLGTTLIAAPALAQTNPPAGSTSSPGGRQSPRQMGARQLDDPGATGAMAGLEARRAGCLQPEQREDRRHQRTARGQQRQNPGRGGRRRRVPRHWRARCGDPVRPDQVRERATGGGDHRHPMAARHRSECPGTPRAPATATAPAAPGPARPRRPPPARWPRIAPPTMQPARLRIMRC